MNLAAQRQWSKYGVCFLLAAITCAAYATLADSTFVAFDDRDYIVGNAHIQAGFSWHSIKWAFTTFHSNNWHPLTWFSHMLDCRLFALDPAGPHLVNLAFHIANTVLLFLLLQNTTSQLWKSAFVAMLFGLHPMHVESVAWVAERKDVLSTFFFILTLLAYARYAELARDRKPMWSAVYGLALLLFALGLMAKPMLVTIPGILFLLDLWPLRRLTLPFRSQPKLILYRLLAEKIPFILLAVLSCYMTFVAQNSTGAVESEAQYPWAQRLLHIPVSYAWYVLKAFWPANLSIFYPLRMDDSFEDAFVAFAVLVAVTVWAFWRARQNPYLLVGWLWFVGCLVPVIGIVQAGSQAYADRYSYIPYIGLFVMFAWDIPELLARWRYRQVILGVGVVLISAACFWRTVVEVKYWKNGPALFQRAIALNPKNYMAWSLLGFEYESQIKYDQAIECMTRATILNDHLDAAWRMLGMLLVIKGDNARAINAYQMALACTWNKDDKITIDNSLGDLLTTAGRDDAAIISYKNSLALSPDQPEVLNNLAWLLAADADPNLRNGTEAVSLAESACTLTHYEEAVLIGTLADAYAEAGRFNDAVAAAQKAYNVALTHNEPETAERNQQLMKFYQSGHAFHENPKMPSGN